MAKALVMGVDSSTINYGGGLDLYMSVSYAGPDVTGLVQNDTIVANVLYNDTIAQMASKITTEVVNIGLSRWGITVARADVLLPSFTWSS